MAAKRTDAQLPFAEAEGMYAERRNRLGLALLRAGADLHLAKFCEWVFNVTGGGKSGSLKKSYAELASSPWGLCCSRNKAIAVVSMALHFEIVCRAESRFKSGSQDANEYQIYWEGIDRLLNTARRPGQEGWSTPWTGQSTAETGQSTAETGQSTAWTHTKEQYLLPGISSKQLSNGTGPENPGPLPSPEAAVQLLEPVTDRNGCGLPPEIAALPELSDLIGRKLTPVSSVRLRYGAFKPLELSHLKSAQAMLNWFRVQASLPEIGRGATQVVPNTAAHCVLVLAASLHAISLPDREITKSRVGCFVGIVSKRSWERVLYKLPDARKSFDLQIDRMGTANSPWEGNSLPVEEESDG